MPCQVGDLPEVEFCHGLAAARAILELGGRKPLRDERFAHPEILEHVERGWMKGRGARFLAQAFPGLQHGHRHAVPDQVGGRRHTNRSRSGDQNSSHVRVILAERSYGCSTVMPARRTISPHLAVSATMKGARSSGVPMAGCAPTSLKRAATAGSASAA